jgi:hypothetical protein
VFADIVLRLSAFRQLTIIVQCDTTDIWALTRTRGGDDGAGSDGDDDFDDVDAAFHGGGGDDGGDNWDAAGRAIGFYKEFVHTLARGEAQNLPCDGITLGT